MKRLNKHMWTKDEIKTIMKLWESSNREEIAEKLGVKVSQITSIAGSIRRAGFPLTKKWKTGYLKSMIKEAIKEYRK